MKNLSVAQKLMLAFGALLILFAAFGIYAEQSAVELGKATKDISDRMELVNRSSDVAIKVQQVRMDVFARKAAQTEEERKAGSDKLAKARDAVETAFDVYTEGKKKTDFGTPEITQQALSELAAERDLWDKYREMSKKSEVSTDPATTSSPELVKAYDDLIASVLQDKANCVRDAHAFEQKGAETASHIKTVTIVAIVVVIVLTLAVLFLLRREIDTSVQAILIGAKRMADGDLRTQVQLENNDEFGQIARSFNMMNQKVNAMMKGVLKSASTVSDTAEQLTTSSQQSAEATQNVAQEITDVAGSAAEQLHSVEQGEASAKTLSDGIDGANKMVGAMHESIANAMEQAEKGSTRASNTAASMNDLAVSVKRSSEIVEQLGQRSQEIGEIVSTISAIAEQTNLLALNAAIEAARAGENGRGFSVVADEVRKLAEASQEATQKITELIHGIQDETEQAVKAMDTGREQAETSRDRVSANARGFAAILERITACNEEADRMVKTMERLRGSVQSIVKATETIGTSARGISGSSQNVSAATEEQAAGMEEIAASARSLLDTATDLTNSVSRFKI